MTTFRSALVATVVLAVFPASAAHAQTDTDGDAVAAIRSLASEAADLVAEEQVLAARSDPRNTEISPAEVADARARLAVVDGRGREILTQLDRLDVDITQSMRATLDALPDPASTSPEQLALAIPQQAVYETAIDDLGRIAATPRAAAGTADRSGGPAIGLVAVAALALFALGAAALGNTLRRRPEHDELAAMAWSDGLTGLANRRRLDHDLVQAGTAGVPTSVIMVDVDHFKSVNDTYGHQHGDEILQRVGAMLERLVRSGDVVYRYGGEEFCILLPGSSVEDATKVADRIVEAAREIELGDGDNLTVSVGVADAQDSDVSTAIETADRALYDAKGLGRDRVVAVQGDRDLEPA